MQRTLGLDMGTNSIGWAVLDVPTEDGEVGEVLAMGSRIFKAGAEVKGNTVTTKARERREKRMMRRQIERRASRRRLLRSELIKVGMLPKDDDAFDLLMDQDPAPLLATGMAKKKLELHEIGRVIYWMSSKRGFLSLRSGGATLVDDDPDFVPTRYRVSQFSRSTGERIHIGQEDILIEFLDGQRELHPKVLTDKATFGARGRLVYPVKPIARDKYASNGSALDEFGIHGLVFFQRKVYWDQATIGACSLDPSSGKRAARAERCAQEFSIWNTIVNLRIGSAQRPLDQAERSTLYKLMSAQQTLAFSKVRKALSLDEADRINFEREDSKGLVGNQTDALLASRLKDAWTDLSEDDKDDLVYLLLGNAPEDQIINQLTKQYGFDEKTIESALKAPLVTGRTNYSRATMRKLLEHLPTEPDVRSAILAAGYPTPEEARAKQPLNLDTMSNPLVRTSLTQLGKVIGALEKRFDRPGDKAFDVVRIELSRDVSMNAKQRERVTKQNRDNEKSRDRAKGLISEFAAGGENSGDNIRAARLWSDQQERCLYCGQNISAVELFSNKVQVDHILPRAQTLDNSMGNVAVVHTKENLDKGERTIYEWVGAERMEEIADRARTWGLPYGKQLKILTEHVDPDTIPASLLTQTGYINSLARDYVALRPNLTERVEVSRGRLTAALLYRLGLKKDRDDHRRHAQDAAMIAITTPRIAQQLSLRFKAERDFNQMRDEGWGSWEPWVGLRQQITDVYSQIVVSHKPTRKVSGQLHEETYYGKVSSPYDDRKDLYARRRGIAGQWNPKQLKEVADPAVREALMQDLRNRGFDPEADKKLTFDVENPPLMPDGNPIVRVRCHMNQPGNRVLRPKTQPKTGVTLANNHVGYVYENINTSAWRIEIATRLDSFIERSNSASSQRDARVRDQERFKYSLCVGDVLALSSSASIGADLIIIRRLVESQQLLWIQPLHESRPGEGLTRLSASGKESLRSLGAQKITVTPDGQIRTNNE